MQRGYWDLGHLYANYKQNKVIIFNKQRAKAIRLLPPNDGLLPANDGLARAYDSLLPANNNCLRRWRGEMGNLWLFNQSRLKGFFTFCAGFWKWVYFFKAF